MRASTAGGWDVALKYLYFIDIYATPDENERMVCRQRYPEEVAEVTRFAERFIEKGREEDLEKAWNRA